MLFASQKWINKNKLLKIVQHAKNISIPNVFRLGKLTIPLVLYVRGSLVATLNGNADDPLGKLVGVKLWSNDLLKQIYDSLVLIMYSYYIILIVLWFLSKSSKYQR